MTIRKKRILVLFILLVLLSENFLGCASKKKDDVFHIRVGYFPNITHSQALVGKATGKFQKALGEKNEIDWKLFNAGPAEIEALFAGEIDLAYVGPGPAINGYSKSNGELQIIAGATDAGAILISRKDLKINNLKELSDKKIVVPQFGNTQDLSLRYILKENGLKDVSKGGNVEILQAQNSDIKTLLDQGDVDLALIPEPWGSRLIKEINANIVLDYMNIWKNENYTTAVVIVSTKFLKEHEDIVEKFIKAHVEVTDYINNNNDKAKDIVNSQIKELTQKSLDKDTIDAAFKRLEVTNNPEKESVFNFLNLSVDAGFLRNEPDTKALFNLDIINKVLRDEGQSEIK